MLKTDKILMFLLLSNLIKNALEASPEKQTITIKIKTHNENHVSIHNFGSIPQEIRDKFFEKFVTANKSGGTGLGTYSSKLIAKVLNSDIQFQTDEIIGTLVTVILPNTILNNLLEKTNLKEI